MRFFSLASRLFVVAAVVLPCLAFGASGVEQKTLTVSPQQIDEALAGKLTYQFVVVGPNEVVDQEGRRFSPKDAKAYLKRAKLEKKAAYVFWAVNDTEIEVAKKVIDVFGDWGATVFVIRKSKPQEAQSTFTVPVDESGQKKEVVLVGKNNPKALTAVDPAPNMSERPAVLRPERLPQRVRYQFRSDAEVVAAAARTEKLLLDTTAKPDATTFKDTAFVLCGAWTHVKDEPAAVQGSKPFVSQMEIDGQLVKVEGRLLNAPEQFTAVVERLRGLIAADRGGTVRALRAREMSHWWVFIGWDIEEPVFVVESRGGCYRLIVAWNGDHVFALDELAALPWPLKK